MESGDGDGAHASTPPSRRCSRTRSSPRGRTRSSTTKSSRTGARTRCSCGAGSRVDLTSIGRLDADAIERVHEEITPRPETARRPARPAVLARRHHAPRRNGRRCGTSSSRGAASARSTARGPICWCATEMFDDADAEFDADDDAAITAVVRGHLELAGITTVAALAARVRTPAGRVAIALAALEQRGLRDAGHATPTATTTTCEWVARRLLARMHSYSRARAGAAASSPRPPRTSCASCCAGSTSRPAPSSRATKGWRRSSAGSRAGRRRRRRGNPSCIAAGCAATTTPRARPPVPRRRGRLVAARTRRRATSTRPRARRTRRRRSRWCSATTSAGCSTRRAIGADPDDPVTRRDRRDPRGAPRARRVLRSRARRGDRTACPKTSSAASVERRDPRPAHLRRLRCDPRAASTERVAAGDRAAVPSDRAAAAAPRRAAGPLVARARPAARRRSTATSSPKRWPSCCSTGGVSCSATSRCARSIRFPWRDVQRALRRLEDRGLVRGGRFVTGFSGEQFALPAAVEQLAHVRKLPRTGERVTVNATDPCNLVGTIVPGAVVPADPHPPHHLRRRRPRLTQYSKRSRRTVRRLPGLGTDPAPVDPGTRPRREPSVLRRPAGLRPRSRARRLHRRLVLRHAGLAARGARSSAAGRGPGCPALRRDARRGRPAAVAAASRRAAPSPGSVPCRPTTRERRTSRRRPSSPTRPAT